MCIHICIYIYNVDNQELLRVNGGVARESWLVYSSRANLISRAHPVAQTNEDQELP